MPGHVDPLHDFFDSTRRCCNVLKEWIHSFILRPCTALIEAPVSTRLFKFSSEGKNHLTLMAPMDPIDILSSDSENETDFVMEKESSLPTGSVIPASFRKLPTWASTSGSNLRGYNGSSKNFPFPITERINNEDEKLQGYPGSSLRGKTLSRHTGLINTPKLPTVNSTVGTDSSYTDTSGKDFVKFSSEQPLKRSLPPSLQPHHSTSTAKGSIENGGSSLVSDTGSTRHHSLGTNIMDRKFHLEDSLDKESNDDIIIYENTDSRRLPPSLTYGKSLHNSQSSGSSDPTYRSGLERNGIRLLPPSLMHGKYPHNSQSAPTVEPAHRSGVDERPSENDERLIFQAALQNLSQPKLEATLPDGLLSVPLLKHQKIALAWMFQKETTSLHCLGGILADDQGLGKTVSMIALILMQKYLQSRSTSEDLPSVKTEALNLDDDDDEGVNEIEKLKPIGEFDDVKKISKASTSSHRGRPAAGTLVVCPASVLRQWARELDEKVADSAKLCVLIYHGGTRTKDPVELAKYDVVLTTFAIVTNEVPKQPLVDDDDDEDQKDGEKYGLSSEFSINKKRKKKSNASNRGKKGRKGVDSSSIDSDSGPLAKVGWFRVILDEAQTIKNHRTQVARACCGLRAKRRWCLSGTPIQNTIDDLYSYFRFLKYDPYSVYQCFTSSIKNTISRNSVTGYKKLQAVLKTIMLRRTKGTLLDGEPIINLPTKSICLTKVDFSIEERDFYSKLEADSRSQFKAYAAAGTVSQNYANILLMLLRLRQACDHPFLVKGYNNSDSVGKASMDMAKKFPRDMLINLLNLLEDSMAICGVCSDPPEDAVVTICGHVFCYQCVSDYITGDDNLCPAHECKEQLGDDVVFSKATIRSCISDELHSDCVSSSEVPDKLSVMQNMYSSSKIRAALEILEKHCKSRTVHEELGYEGTNGVNDSSKPSVSKCHYSYSSSGNYSTQLEGPFKAIVFSQWTGMLDLVENSLNHSCIQYRRFDGKMTLASRDKAVKDFNNDPEVTVMLMSLKAGNLGLNMVAACHVILLDLWWNPTTEDQAIDRAHRIGQTRPVTVSRLTVKDTVEDRILALQEEKRKMVASAFGEDQKGGSGARLTVEDLRYLFMV